MLFVTEYCVRRKKINGGDISAAMTDWANTFGGRKDHALKHLLEHMLRKDEKGKWHNCGANDNQGKHNALRNNIGANLLVCVQMGLIISSSL
jgi:hypothetical protein